MEASFLHRHHHTLPISSLSPPAINRRSSLFTRLTINAMSASNPVGGWGFDSVAYEAERLSLVSQAQEVMAELALVQGGSEDDPKAWKWRIQKRVWDLMEAEGIAQNSHPDHHRIPNFVGAALAAEKAAAGGKKLLTSQPRLRTGFFSVLELLDIPSGRISEACTSVGVAKYGRPIRLDAKIKVDLIVIGSVAVDPKTGARLGKGSGFAELEYGMLRYMGAIDDSTLIVTSGIYWDKLSQEKVRQIQILRELKSRIESETGQSFPCGPSEKLSPTAQRRQRRR